MTSTKVYSNNEVKALVTRPHIPDLSKYMRYVEQAFHRKQLTNGGPLLHELTQRLKDYLGVEHLLLVNNGTSALQLAYRLKGLSGKTVCSTPFTFPATLTALDWQNANLVFADIDRQHWGLCPDSVSELLQTTQLDAIVPVNIFGCPCDLAAFDQLGQAHNLPIIYDSAQAFLSQYKGKSIFHHGDIHCISFHATKLFHCVEGGALTFNNEADFKRAEQLINFGIGEHGVVYESGINAKMSELHAAMGLCILDDLAKLIEDRMTSVAKYKQALAQVVEFQTSDFEAVIPPMYMPVKFASESALLAANDALNRAGYQARRYFYPNNHKFLQVQASAPLNHCHEVTNKVLCLPLMYGLASHHITAIADIIKSNLD